MKKIIAIAVLSLLMIAAFAACTGRTVGNNSTAEVSSVGNSSAAEVSSVADNSAAEVSDTEDNSAVNVSGVGANSAEEVAEGYVILDEEEKDAELYIKLTPDYLLDRFADKLNLSAGSTRAEIAEALKKYYEERRKAEPEKYPDVTVKIIRSKVDEMISKGDKDFEKELSYYVERLSRFELPGFDENKVEAFADVTVTYELDGSKRDRSLVGFVKYDGKWYLGR